MPVVDFSVAESEPFLIVVVLLVIMEMAVVVVVGNKRHCIIIEKGQGRQGVVVVVGRRSLRVLCLLLPVYKCDFLGVGDKLVLLLLVRVVLESHTVVCVLYLCVCVFVLSPLATSKQQVCKKRKCEGETLCLFDIVGFVPGCCCALVVCY